MLSDLKRIIDQISRDRGIDKSLLVKAIEEAVEAAAKKKFGSRRDIEVRYNEEFGEVDVFQFRTVVEEVQDEQTEICVTDARILDPEVQIDDDLGEKMTDITELGRIAAQSAKQVIINRMKDAERDVIFNMYQDRVGEVVSGIVQRFERGNMIVNLGRTDAILPKEHQIPKRTFKQGDRIRAYLLEVRQTSRDCQLILSRTCDEFLEKLFQMEVPEMSEGIVRVVGVSREPGFRAKIAVSSSESDVDPVGACVGMKGSRVQNVVQELQGERIDIVTWSPDAAKYVYNALAPAHVSMVRADDDHNSLLVVVPNDQLSLAIGRQGQNVRLASKLLGCRIDVKSEQRYNNLQNPGYMSILALNGIDEGLADQLYSRGIVSTAVLAEKVAEDLTVLRAIDEEYAEKLIASAKANPYVEAVVTEESAEADGTENENVNVEDSSDTVELDETITTDDEVESESEASDADEAPAEQENEEASVDDATVEQENEEASVDDAIVEQKNEDASVNDAHDKD